MGRIPFEQRLGFRAWSNWTYPGWRKFVASCMAKIKQIWQNRLLMLNFVVFKIFVLNRFHIISWITCLWTWVTPPNTSHIIFICDDPECWHSLWFSIVDIIYNNIRFIFHSTLNDCMLHFEWNFKKIFQFIFVSFYFSIVSKTLEIV